MQDVGFRKWRVLRVSPFQPATISTDALILILFLLAGYGLRALTEKRER